MSGQPLVLASSSPRRALLLSSAGFTFDIRIPDTDEQSFDGEPASETVLRLSDDKARAVSRDHGEVVLAADTLVVLDGLPMGKPENRSEALGMLAQLSGSTHSVLTGWAILGDGAQRFGVAESRVTFKELSTHDIEAYVNDVEPFDKAGAYGLQGENGRLIEGVRGSRANVMGLPLRDIVAALSELGIDRKTSS